MNLINHLLEKLKKYFKLKNPKIGTIIHAFYRPTLA